MCVFTCRLRILRTTIYTLSRYPRYLNKFAGIASRVRFEITIASRLTTYDEHTES